MRASSRKVVTETLAYGSKEPVDRSGVRPRLGASVSTQAGQGAGCGLRLGQYELLELLGKGSSGYVYRARHMLLDRSVAIKVLCDDLAEDAASIARFVAEARAVNLLDHPHVLAVTDIVMAQESGEVPWIVMELLEGSDLAVLINRNEINLPRALSIMRDVCEGLDAIHSVGIVHRDVKPENIFITQRNGHDVAKLIDFGIARLHDPRSAEPVVSHEVVGTPSYMAPEQTGHNAIDHRADLYAVGAVLLELITGLPPFPADELEALLEQLKSASAPRASSRVALPKAIRRDLDRTIARCLRKDPKRRPASARALVADIADIEQKLSAAQKIEALARRRPERVRRFRRPSFPRGAWMLAAAVLAGICGAYAVDASLRGERSTPANVETRVTPASQSRPQAAVLPVPQEPEPLPAIVTSKSARPPAPEGATGDHEEPQPQSEPSVRPTDDVQRRWEATIEALKQASVEAFQTLEQALLEAAQSLKQVLSEAFRDL